jgi:Fic family protein
MHEQFEAIHPVLDGNGRLGRLLIPLFLMERGRLSQPLLYWSAFGERHRSQYYDCLQRVRTHGDWTGWLHFFLAGITEASLEAVRQAGTLMDLRERWRGSLRGKPRALALVDEIFVNPYVTVARAAKALGVSNPTARQVVVQLEKQGILEEITGRAWGRLYLARAVLNVIQPRAGAG